MRGHRAGGEIILQAAIGAGEVQAEAVEQIAGERMAANHAEGDLLPALAASEDRQAAAQRTGGVDVIISGGIAGAGIIGRSRDADKGLAAERRGVLDLRGDDIAAVDAADIVDIGDADGEIVVIAGDQAGFADADESAGFDRELALAERLDLGIDELRVAVEIDADDRAELEIDAGPRGAGDRIDIELGVAGEEAEIMDLAARRNRRRQDIVVRALIARQIDAADAERQAVMVGFDRGVGLRILREGGYGDAGQERGQAEQGRRRKVDVIDRAPDA